MVDFKEIINRSVKIREQYHKLEKEYHGSIKLSAIFQTTD